MTRSDALAMMRGSAPVSAGASDELSGVIAAFQADVRDVGEDPRPSRLYRRDVAPRATTRLTSGNDSYTNLSWSPDGSQIAVQREAAAKIQDFQNSDIALVSRSGDVRMLVTTPGSDRDPVFSPDGK